MIEKEALLNYFAKDKFANDVVGITVERVEEDLAVCRLTLNDSHCNSQGAVMGGVTFTLGDYAFAVFANRHEIATVSLSASISYLGVAKGRELIATVTPIKEGRSVKTAEVAICDELGNAVAHMVMNGFCQKR